jgi:lipopolysaccharide export system permease protein
VGRLAEDREVVALGAAGLSTARLVKVPLLLGLLLAAVGLWITVDLEPRSLTAARALLVDVVKRNVRNDVKPGTFYDQIPGTTLYAERVRGGRWENVLISDRSDPDAPVLALAREGRLEPVGAGGEMELVLGGGELHRVTPGDDEYVIAAFERAEVVLGLGTALSDRGGLVKGSTEDLGAMAERARAARARGEVREANRIESSLHRKLAAALAVVPFALLAVPLGAARRAGRAFGVGATFGVVILHYLLLRSGQVMAQRGTLPAELALQLPTVLLSLGALALIALQARRGPGAVR